MSILDEKIYYKLTPLLWVSQHLKLPSFNIEIHKNVYDVWICHILDFNLYTYSIHQKYKIALKEIKQDTQKVVISHILEALNNDKINSIYGKKCIWKKELIINKLSDSYNTMTVNKLHKIKQKLLKNDNFYKFEKIDKI